MNMRKNFKFKVNESLGLDFTTEVGIIYSAKQCEINEDLYIISWIDQSTNAIEEIGYHKDIVKEVVKNNEWLII